MDEAIWWKISAHALFAVTRLSFLIPCPYKAKPTSKLILLVGLSKTQHSIICFEFPLLGENASGTSSISEETRKDLKFVLDKNRKEIVQKYARYIKCIRLAIVEKGVSVCELRSYLFTLEAFKSNSDAECKLFSGAEQELEKATTVYQLLDIVTKNYASFLDYGVYKSIVDGYDIDQGQEELKYSEHLEKYIKKHKISELVMVLPKLCPSTEDTTMLSIKLDVKGLQRFSKITDLQDIVADVLGLLPKAIRLQSIDEGCVVVTFCIPTPVADIIFTREKTFTRSEKERLCSLSVVWLEYNGHKFYFPPAAEAPAAEGPTGSSSGKLNWGEHEQPHSPAAVSGLRS